jgi:F-type H+-transporting ATPase subunit b
MVAPAASSGSFLITPNVGLMVWTLLLFGIAMWFLAKTVFPRIAATLDKRQKAIEDSIDTAEKTRVDARQQAEEIVTRARRSADTLEHDAQQDARAARDQLMEQTKRDIESETRRAIQEIRREVADLTVAATEKVTRKTLTEDDQRRLVEDALSELDFSALTSEGSGR